MNVYFDNNIMAEIVRAAIDPAAALAGSEFVVSVTPDLAAEYRQAIAHPHVQMAEKELCRRLLEAAGECGIFGFDDAGFSGFDHGKWATADTIETFQSIKIADRPGKEIPKNRTDAFLVALAHGAVVITNDPGSHFKRARAAGRHVYKWNEITSGPMGPSDVARRLGKLLVQRV